jgi:glycosyltransferase involved in cell wall biosynthesis
MMGQKSTADATGAALERAPHSEIVTIVLPTYNRCRLVCRAIDSVLDQSYHAYELIVVDDGSTDATADRLASYGDRVTVIKQANRGVSAARNAGIQAASGEYIALLDSDDVWLPQKLERQIAFFKTRPQAVICQTEEIWIRNGVRVNPGKRHKKHSGMIFEKTLPLCLVSPSAVMIRKSLFDKVGLFDESLPACEDYDLWLRICWKYPVHLIDTPLIIKYGGHADQLSRMPELDKYRIRALEKILETGCLSQRQRSAAMETLKEKCRIYAAGCSKRGRIDDARYYTGLPGKIGDR